MMGNFNAKIGNNNEDVKHIMRKCGLPHRNENGDLLLELCGKHGLAIGGTLFPHKDCHRQLGLPLDQEEKFKIKETISASARDGKSYSLMSEIREMQKLDLTTI
jgi:hypothetical protein